MTSLSTLPGFLSHFAAGLALLALATFAYTSITPIREVALIRQGNNAAAVALGGAILGFALPIGAAISNSANLVDAAVWGLVALVAQLAAWFAVTRLLGPGWRSAIEERSEMAGAILKAAVAVGVGMLNAAAMST